MPSYRLLAYLLLSASLPPLAGCGSKESPKPVAQNSTPEPPEVVEPPPPPPPRPKLDPTPQPPTEPFRPMGRPDPLPPYEEEPTPGPVVRLPDPPPQNPPMPPGPGGPAPMPPQPAEDPNKKPVFPEFIAGRDLNEWLKEATTHKDPQYREAALKMLPRFGPDARQKIILPLCDIIRGIDSDLVKVRETDPGVRIAAIAIVSNLGFDFRIDDDKATPEEKKKKAELLRQSRHVIGALMAVIAETGQGSFLRMYCAQSLATFGPDAHKAVPQLRMLASDINWATRHAVAQSLGVIGGPAEKDEKGDKDAGPHEPATDVLLNVSLKDRCAAVRVAAAQSLLRLGPPKPKNPADLAKALEKFLKPLNARIEPAPPTGKVAEEDIDVLVWLWLLQLSYDGSKLDGNVKKIAGAIKEAKTSGVRVQGLFALAALGPAAAPAMPTVREMLDRYDDPMMLLAAMEVCASMGTKGGADALPELQAIRNGKHAPKKPDGAPKDWQPDPTLRYAAEDCIAVVTGKRKLPEVKKDPTKDEPEPKK